MVKLIILYASITLFHEILGFRLLRLVWWHPLRLSVGALSGSFGLKIVALIEIIRVYWPRLFEFKQLSAIISICILGLIPGLHLGICWRIVLAGCTAFYRVDHILIVIEVLVDAIEVLRKVAALFSSNFRSKLLIVI